MSPRRRADDPIDPAAPTTDGADRPSVTRWIRSLKAGDDETAGKSWGNDSDDLVRLARALPHCAPRAVAGEDAALSAFSFCRGTAPGRYPRLENRDDLLEAIRKAMLPCPLGI